MKSKYLLVAVAAIALLINGCKNKPASPRFYQYAPGSGILNSQETLLVQLNSDGTAIFTGNSATNKASYKETDSSISFYFGLYQQEGFAGAVLVFHKDGDAYIFDHPVMKVKLIPKQN